jgi:hypothetical protein
MENKKNKKNIYRKKRRKLRNNKRKKRKETITKKHGRKDQSLIYRGRYASLL